MIASTKNIIQWNLNGFHNKIDEIKLIINQHNPIAICIQETNIKKDDSLPNIKNYTIAFKNRNVYNRASGGVGILVHTAYPWEKIPIISHLEVVAVTITLEYKTTLCNIYLPNQTPLKNEDITDIIKQLPHPFILVGDFNSHNLIWGSQKTDARGKEVEKILEDDNIVLLNKGDQTRLNPINGNFSAIDLSFSTVTLAQRLNWQVLPEINSSDHLPIIIEIMSTVQEVKLSQAKWKLINPNWDTFADLVETYTNSIDLINSNSNIDEIVSLFTNSTIQAAEKTFGYAKPYTYKNKVPW